MTRTTTSGGAKRWTTAGALALAACALAVGAAPGGRTAEAASANPFAGSYQGTGPVTNVGWPVDINARGNVSATATSPFFGLNWKSRLTGSVADDGTFTYKVEFTVTGHARGFFTDVPGAADGASPIADSSSSVVTGTATLTKNADGSITGTGSDGVAIAWVPR